MKTIFISISLVLFMGFCAISLQRWGALKRIKEHDLRLLREVEVMKEQVEHLRMAGPNPIDAMGNNYHFLEQRFRHFSRYHQYKTVVEIIGMGKDGLVVSAAKPSPWLGIQELSGRILFYNLKGVDQNVIALQFLQDLETHGFFRIKAINQQNNLIEVVFKLYGRDV